MKQAVFYVIIVFTVFSCTGNKQQEYSEVPIHDSEMITVNMDTVLEKPAAPVAIDSKSANRNDIVDFAKTQIGIPYKWAGTDPKDGFDCSGFITYVFNHYNIQVPRSSVNFTNVGKPVELAVAKPGDLILFTGTDSTIRIVGHMGIVVENVDTLRFIHSTSGKQYGVTITALNTYYMGRFVKVIDIF
ncbi:MAG: C40 family peptidase [Ferruginibacter sp.]